MLLLTRASEVFFFLQRKDREYSIYKWDCFISTVYRRYFFNHNGILAGYYKKGQLAPGHLTEMSKRYAVKMFLSHLFEVWYEKHHGHPAPQPYILVHSNGEHTQKIEPFPSVVKKKVARKTA